MTARMPRGSNVFYEVWITDTALTLPGAYTLATLRTALNSHTLAVCLDSEATDADAALEAAPFIKISDAGNPGNTGNDLKKGEFECRITGLQTTGDNTILGTIQSLDGNRMTVYMLDKTLGIVKQLKNVPVMYEEDATGNAPDIRILKGEITGDIDNIYDETVIALS
jgi:hypothetical protein